jgi:hypothetical protein
MPVLNFSTNSKAYVITCAPERYRFQPSSTMEKRQMEAEMAIRAIGLVLALGCGLCHASDKEFALMDGDKDGRVTRAEHAEGARKMFDMMDANLDGKVTAAEMRGAYKAITGKTPARDTLSAEEKIKVVDSDGDGILTVSEHAAGAASMFTMMDADKDGILTKAEMAQAHKAMLKK